MYIALISLALPGALLGHASAESVIVCALDSGCNIAGAQGWDFLSDTGDLADPLGHDTRVYSIIAELAPQAQVYMLKCFESGETFREEAVIAALYAAVDDYHADIINMSWTVNAQRPALYEAIRYAYESGAVMVASVGNLSLSTGLGSTTYPAAWDEVIGVGGVNLGDNGKPMSSLLYLRNDSVYVCARADYGAAKGSSYASARVAAFAARYLSDAPDAAEKDIRQMMKDAALDTGEPGYDTVYGWGYIDAECK